MKHKCKTAKKAAPTRSPRVPVRLPVLSRQPAPWTPAPCTPARLTLVQPALKVGAANDPYEHEAERMAERVLAMPAPQTAPPVARPTDASSATPPTNPAVAAQRAGVDDQPNLDSLETAPPIPADHQDPEVGQDENVATEEVDKGELDELESESPKPLPGDVVAADRGPDAAAAVGPEGGPAPTDVARRVEQPGAGRPLPDGVRRFMEPRFGADFADVRIHDAPQDRRAARRIGARAFTSGEHIWLGDGESVDNRRLLAHELTHVLQQTGRPPSAPVDASRMPTARRAAAPTVQRGMVADKAEEYARDVPGYRLITVILGKSPITGRRVERSATNLIGGFLGLLPGGNRLFERLQETRALEDAFTWVESRLGELNITWNRVVRLVEKLLDEMPSLSPVKVAKRIFQPLVDDLLSFLGAVKDKVLEVIVHGALKLAGPYGEKVWEVIQKARETISLIVEDPLGFAKNLVRAVVGGFKQFSSGIWEHLKKGMLGWLFGTLQGAGIEMPERLDFKGLISVGLQIVGLTYGKFRAMLVKRLGKDGERKVAFIEKSVEVVTLLVKEGFLAVWQRLLTMIEGFMETVIGGIRTFITETLVMGAVSWVAGLSNPVGAIVKVALSIYNMIKAFLERIDQIVDVANSIFSSIGSIAKGQLEKASDFIEKTMAATIPVVLAFVAAVIPINGITRSIRNIIKKLQAPVDKAMQKMVDFLVKKVKKLFSKLLGKVNRKRKLPGFRFKVGTEEHSLYAKRKGKGFELLVASNPEGADKVQADVAEQAKQAQGLGDDSPQLELFKNAFRTDVDKAQKRAKATKPDDTVKSQQQPAKEAAQATEQAAKNLDQPGEQLQFDLFIEVNAKEGGILRAREPRIPELEGKVDTHYQRGQETAKLIGERVKGKRALERISTYYENDHMPEKSLGKLVKGYLDSELTKDPAKDEDASIKRSGTKSEPSKGEAKKVLLGDIDRMKVGEKAGSLPAMTVYRPSHRQKTASDAAGRDHGKVIANAKKGATLDAKIAQLRQGISASLDEEIATTKALYENDKDATAAIRKQVSAGFKDLYGENQRLFGISAEAKAPVVDEAGAGTGLGSDLPITGDEKRGIPSFLKLEGAKTAHKAKPRGVGAYLEYDHVIDANLAEKARDLTLGDPVIKEKVEPRMTAKLAAGDDEAAATARQRLEGLERVKVFDGAEVASYDAAGAGTIALYRPIHRQITPPLNSDAKRGILTKVDLSRVGQALADHAVTGDATDLTRGVEAIKTGVRNRWNEALLKHIAAIEGEYDTEITEVGDLNAGKDASQPMNLIVARVKLSLSGLNEESVNLLG